MTSLHFYVVNYNNGYMRKQYECVTFELVESDFKSPFQEFSYKKLEKWHHYGCKNIYCKDNSCADCEQLQNLIEKIPNKWKNIQGTYYKYNDISGKEILIDNKLLDEEFTKIRYDVGGEEYEKAVDKMKKLSDEYLDSGLVENIPIN